MRALAFERATKLHDLSGVAVRELYDALELHALCGQPVEPPAAPTAPADTATRAGAEALPDDIGGHLPLHVVATPVEEWGQHGSAPPADGSAARPYRSIGAALTVARARRVRGGPPAAIVLHDGIHFLNETLELGPADSRTVVTAAPGASAWVSGGVPLVLEWRKHEGGVVGRGGAGPTVYVADVTDPHVADIPALQAIGDPTRGGDASYGPRRFTRARYPNGDWETDQWGLCSTNECLAVGPAYTTPQRWGGPQSLTGANAIPKSSVARWWQPPPKPLPAQTFFNATQGGGACATATRNCTTYDFSLGHGGPCALWASWDSDPANSGTSYWCGARCAGGGAGEDSNMAKSGWLGLPLGVTFNKSSEVYARMQRWRSARGAVVHAWMDSSWFTNMFEVTGVDLTAGNLSFEDPAMPGFPKGGWQGGRNWRGGVNNLGGDSTVAPLIVENVFEELDAPGEFYYDKTTRRLYMIPNGTAAGTSDGDAGAPPPTRLVASRLQTLVRVAGSQTNPVRDVVLSGFGWRDAAPTLMERWGVPSGGDWSLYHGAALELHGVRDVTVRGCRFVRLDNNAILLSGYTRAVAIRNNTAAFLGMSFAAAWGDTNGIDGTKGNQPRGTVVDSNLVREIGIFEKQSSVWFQAKSCGNVLSNNVAFNMPRAAMNFNDNFGGNTTIANNVIWNTCRESGDHGPLNSWSRLPFVTHVKYGRDQPPSFESAPNEVFGNFISADYGGSQAFDNDDGSSDWHTHHNVWQWSDGVKMDYSGHDSEFHHNLVVVNAYDGQNCINGGGFPPGHRNSFHDNRCVIAGCKGANRTDYHGACNEKTGNFDCAVGEGGAVSSSWILHNNTYHTPKGNATLPCGVSVNAAATAAEINGSGAELGSRALPLPTDDELVRFAKQVLGME